MAGEGPDRPSTPGRGWSPGLPWRPRAQPARNPGHLDEHLNRLSKVRVLRNWEGGGWGCGTQGERHRVGGTDRSGGCPRGRSPPPHWPGTSMATRACLLSKHPLWASPLHSRWAGLGGRGLSAGLGRTEACSHTAGQKAAGEEQCCPFTSEETEAQTALFESPRPLSVGPLSLEPTWQWASEPGLFLLCGAAGWPLSPRAQAGLGVVPPHREQRHVWRKGHLSLICTMAPKTAEVPRRQWPNPGLSGRASQRRPRKP